jgi:hypothetical protein
VSLSLRVVELVFVFFLVFFGRKATRVILWEFRCPAISGRFLIRLICIFEARLVIIRRSSLDMRPTTVFVVIFRSSSFKSRPRRSFGAQRVANTRQ